MKQLKIVLFSRHCVFRSSPPLSHGDRIPPYLQISADHWNCRSNKDLVSSFQPVRAGFLQTALFDYFTSDSFTIRGESGYLSGMDKNPGKDVVATGRGESNSIEKK